MFFIVPSIGFNMLLNILSRNKDHTQNKVNQQKNNSIKGMSDTIHIAKTIKETSKKDIKQTAKLQHINLRNRLSVQSLSNPKRQTHFTDS